METNQINRELNGINEFIGTFACDQLNLKKKLPRPFALVINTDKISERGEHWTAIFAQINGEPEYFDSFGFPPLIKEVQMFLDLNCSNHWYYSSNSIQHPFSMTCGQFCIKFIKHRHYGNDLKSFISKFCSTTAHNDDILFEM